LCADLLPSKGPGSDAVLLPSIPIMFMLSVVIDCSMHVHVPLQVLLINSVRIG